MGLITYSYQVGYKYNGPPSMCQVKDVPADAVASTGEQ